MVQSLLVFIVCLLSVPMNQPDMPNLQRLLV